MPKKYVYLTHCKLFLEPKTSVKPCCNIATGGGGCRHAQRFVAGRWSGRYAWFSGWVALRTLSCILSTLWLLLYAFCKGQQCIRVVVHILQTSTVHSKHSILVGVGERYLQRSYSTLSCMSLSGDFGCWVEMCVSIMDLGDCILSAERPPPPPASTELQSEADDSLLQSAPPLPTTQRNHSVSVCTWLCYGALVRACHACEGLWWKYT